MDPYNSLDELKVITALLHDVFYLFGDVFSIKQRQNTLEKVRKRCTAEGMSFLTKTLPKLGKALDKALTGYAKLNATGLRFSTMPGSELPSFLGELFSLVFHPDGSILPQPNCKAVGVLRDVLYCFYKYELPYTADIEDSVISQFLRTEDDLSSVTLSLDAIRGLLCNETSTTTRRRKISCVSSDVEVAREARILISRVFASFDPHDIVPRHGPGAVATKQRLWDKFCWTNVSTRITDEYPLDEYFYSSLGHVCDELSTMELIKGEDLPARVVLVPKDSRGPRLISCEPVDFQWIQQGLGKAIVDELEANPLTKWNIHFADQQPNQFGALLGSKTGKYATLDLKEASDRISLSLVRLLFPEPLLSCLEACRSTATRLPNGQVLKLLKYAPMGSSLCFPVLATVTWAILTAAAPDEDTRESILVYGDDVIVPAAYAEDAMRRLESFGLLVNRDKSCTSGFFRESCGTDAFNGINVTPVRIRTVWSSKPSPEVYTSWIAYANAMRRKQYFSTYELIAGSLHHVYGRIPATDMCFTCPSLDEVPDNMRPNRVRSARPLGNPGVKPEYQRKEWLVRDITSPVISKNINGWSMLLRYFTEAGRPPYEHDHLEARPPSFVDDSRAFSVSEYTRRDTTTFTFKWVAAERQPCPICKRRCATPNGVCVPVI